MSTSCSSTRPWRACDEHLSAPLGRRSATPRCRSDQRCSRPGPGERDRYHHRDAGHFRRRQLRLLLRARRRYRRARPAVPRPRGHRRAGRENAVQRPGRRRDARRSACCLEPALPGALGRGHPRRGARGSRWPWARPALRRTPAPGEPTTSGSTLLLPQERERPSPCWTKDAGSARKAPTSSSRSSRITTGRRPRPTRRAWRSSPGGRGNTAAPGSRKWISMVCCAAAPTWRWPTSWPTPTCQVRRRPRGPADGRGARG
jgi:hypothetical protein